MPQSLPLLRSIAQTLDDLDVGVCVFDVADGALLWNHAFLKFFPEHAAHIHVGEPYRVNLRRFYEGRLSVQEMPAIERYIEEGVLRHRAQQRSYTFEHRGIRLRVASLPLPGVGRIRIWKADGPPKPGDFERAVAIPGSTGEPPPIDTVALFDYVADGVMMTGADNRTVWVNEPFVVMYGFRDRAAATGVNLEETYRGAWKDFELEDPPRFEQGLSILAENMRFSGAPFEVPLPGDRWARVIEQRSPDGRGFSVHVDITALKRQHHQLLLAERRARHSEALLVSTLEQMEEGVMMLNAQHVVEVCNRRALELLGLPEALMASRPTFESVLAYQRSVDEFRDAPEDVRESVRSGRMLDQPHRYDRKLPDGRVIEIHSMPLKDGGVLRTYADITERKRHEAHVHHLARHDGLTSLVNRDVFMEYLADAVDSCSETGEGFAVHFIDLDRFKPINDQFGHLVGDQVLAVIADRMRQIVREADVVARMGGDEFAILQYRADKVDGGLGLARRVLEGIARPVVIEERVLQVGASIGIAVYPTAGSDADTLVRNADKAMYAAKAARGNCVRVCGVSA